MIPLFLAPFQLEIEAITKRRNGRTEIIRQPAHSPLKNWVQIMKALFDGSEETIIDTSGAQQTFDGTMPTSKTLSWCNAGTRSGSTSFYINVDAGEGNANYGILAGYGTNPVSMDDYQLASKYEHGEGLGYLFYKNTIVSLAIGGEVTIDTKTYKTMTLIIQRPVENRHTEQQTINEIGLVIQTYVPTNVAVYVLIFRDVLDNPITLAPYEATTLRYHLRWLIPKT